MWEGLFKCQRVQVRSQVRGKEEERTKLLEKLVLRVGSALTAQQ